MPGAPGVTYNYNSIVGLDSLNPYYIANRHTAQDILAIYLGQCRTFGLGQGRIGTVFEQKVIAVQRIAM